MATYTASATTGTTCACCGTLSAVTLQCRTRGGTATLCGYSEWDTHASTPPKKYRTLTQGGAYTFVFYTDLTCTTRDMGKSNVVCTWAGTCTYNESNCALTQGGTQDCGGGPSTNCGNLGGDFQPNSADTNTSATTVQAIVTGTCRIGGGSQGKYEAANQFATLSDEDTEQDAIDRLIPDPDAWGGFLSPGASGCTGTPPPCCLARWEERTSGFSFVYQEAQYRVTASGLNPSTSYNARVEIYRRTFGSGTYTLFQTLIVSGTTDGSGAFSEDGDVPSEKCFESYAYAAYIVIPS
jgi:hypothetical protein